MAKHKTPPAQPAAADVKPDAVAVDGGEGESQTLFIPPAEGGRYIRNPDGSLTRVEGPGLKTKE